MRSEKFGWLSPFRFLLAALALLALPSAVQAAKWYVDNTLGEVKPEEKVVPANPKPVQLLFEFQRDGAPNPKVTKLVKPWAFDNIKATGVFSEVSEAPVADGAVLSIRFNNVVDPAELEKLKKKAFGAGLSFGLFSGVVATDNYIVTFEYVAKTGAEPIRTEVRHALHMKFGKTDVEIPGTQVKNVDEAVKMVVRQALARGVNTIAADTAFPK